MQWINKLFLHISSYDMRQLRENFTFIFTAFQYFFEFSATETDTGMRWIDGSIIYRKVVTISAYPNTTTTTTAHGISGLGLVIKAWANADDGTDQISVMTTSAQKGAASPSVTITYDNTNITIKTNWNMAGFAGFVIMEYTKT